MRSSLFLVFVVSSLFSCSQSEATSGKAKKQIDLPSDRMDTLTLGGGCYWCVEAVYERLEGVQEVISGYSGGRMKDPTYEMVCTGTTGHAEVVRVIFDTTKTSVYEVLKVFFTVHDPTTLNRQGADVGTQYRSVIFYRNEQQRRITGELIAVLNEEKVYPNPVVTEVSPLKAFYIAEDYHQDYYARNPSQGYCRLVIQPKIDKFEKVFKDRLKED